MKTMMKKSILSFLLSLVVVFCVTTLKAQKETSIYDFKLVSLEGDTIDFSTYKDKVLLIVNTASKCGLTPQYEGLELLYREYKDKGLEILGFPCNQFLEQEPGTAAEIRQTCLANYGVTFQMFEKIDVNGKNESPLYTFLKKKAPFKSYPNEEFGKQLDAIHKQLGNGFEQGDNIRWNFSKFLVSKDGKTIKRFEPMVAPDDLREEIENLLK